MKTSNDILTKLAESRLVEYSDVLYHVYDMDDSKKDEAEKVAKIIQKLVQPNNFKECTGEKLMGKSLLKIHTFFDEMYCITFCDDFLKITFEVDGVVKNLSKKSRTDFIEDDLKMICEDITK